MTQGRKDWKPQNPSESGKMYGGCLHDSLAAYTIPAGGFASCNVTTLTAADVSGDGRVTSLDALVILQAAADSIEL